MDNDGRAGVLGRCALFSGFPAQDLHRLAAGSSLRRYRRGQFVVLEGDPGDALLVVAEGSLKAVTTSSHRGGAAAGCSRTRRDGGELTVADGGACSATVTALSDASVVRIPRDAGLAVAEHSPALLRTLPASLAGTVRRLPGDAADLVFLDTPSRVAKLLLGLAPTGSARHEPAPVVHLELTQSELAQRRRGQEPPPPCSARRRPKEAG